ncbi:MAG: choice-of-anchor Q domain-containing protein [Cyanobacteria bacterium J06641_5]
MQSNAIVDNTTIANNIADADNDGEGIAGGIFVDISESFTLINSTVLNNIGGGIYSNSVIESDDSSLIVVNSIIAFSEGGSDFMGGTPDIFGRNIVADNSLGSFLNGIESVDPATLLFSELQDNGGPTETFLPLEGNPVIDFGDNTFLSEQGFFNTPTFEDEPEEFDFNRDGDLDDVFLVDQRGLDRIFNGTVDIGAVEVNADDGVTVPPPLPDPPPEEPDSPAPEDPIPTEPDPAPEEPETPEPEAPEPTDPVPGALIDLDVDDSGAVEASVDVLNIFRVLAGAPQAVVVPADASVSQQDVVDAVNAFPDLSLDVDNSSAVEASVDVLNIFRVLAGAPQAVVIPDGASVSQQDVVDAVNEFLT